MFTGIATWIAKSVLGGWLSKIGAAIQWLFKAWYRIVIALLLGACIWFYVGWTSADNRATKWKRTAEQEMSLRIANEVAYKKAQQDAADLNRKQVEKAEQQRKELALGKDIEIRRSINAALADARRVWAARAVKGSSGNAQTGEIAGSAVDPNGAGGVPEFFTEDDVRICATNTLKAKGWQDFYEGLREAE